MEGEEKNKRFKVKLEVDVAAKAMGFDSAQTATPAHHRIMKNYSSTLLAGPDPSDDLLEMMTHLFTEDEADLVQHLPPLRPRKAEKVAMLSARSVEDVTKVLDRLSDTKKVIAAHGDPRRYFILPVVPGTFEMALMRPDLSGLNTWHTKFAELFEKIWNTGFVKNYVTIRPAPVRYLPALGVADTLQMAWPSDRLEEILDRYDKFAIGHCQCRLATRLVGEGCDKPTENCTWFGPLADLVLDRGLMRRTDKQEILEVKKEAEANGCITWMMNKQGDAQGNASCSCCGCCCHGLRTINQFSAPGFFSKPHFMPKLNFDNCNLCGKCQSTCPMGAWSKIGGAQLFFDQIRCVGCGLCVMSCKFNALELKPMAEAPKPQKSWNALALKNAPDMILNSFKTWLRRIVYR